MVLPYQQLFSVIKDKNNFLVLTNLEKPGDLLKISEETEIDRVKTRNSIKSLEKFSLVEKKSEVYFLTEIGAQIVKKTKGISFLSSNSSYFLGHKFEEIPTSLLQRIEEFSNCKIINSIWPVSTRLVEMVKNTSEFVNCIFSEPPFLLAEPLYEKIHSGIKFKILFGQNSKLNDCNDLIEKMELNKPKQNQLFEKRICEQVITNVVVTDKEACLMLGYKNNLADMTNAISSEDVNFIQWCNDFFDFKWNHGEPFARLRV